MTLDRMRFSDGSQQETSAITLLPPNIITNGYMDRLEDDGVTPEGWVSTIELLQAEQTQL